MSHRGRRHEVWEHHREHGRRHHNGHGHDADDIVKHAVGGYLAWGVLVVVFAWPCAVFHGPARWIAESAWIALLAGAVFAIRAARKSAKAKRHPQ